MLRENVHQSLHTVFQNATPIQRIRRTLEMDKTVLHPDIYTAISRTLQRFEGQMEVLSYEKACIDEDKFIQTLSYAL
jgi:hypothetical protein